MNLSLLLKQETRSLHERVDQHIVLKRLMLTNLSLAKYYTALSALRDWHNLLSHNVDFSLIPKQLFDHKIHIERINSDLFQLDRKLIDEPPDSSNFHANQFSSLNSNHPLGYFYVAQGSMLGGQHILRRLKHALGEEQCHNICQYFTGYGIKTQEVWTQSSAFLNAQELTPNERTEVISSAQEAFSSLLVILNRYQAEELKENSYA